MKKLSTLLLGLLVSANSIAGTLPLRQATASQTVLIGPFIDTDGAPVTGLTIDAADVRISVNGGNIAGKNSGGCTHDELGMYACTFDATDTATVGRFQVTVSESGALIVTKDFVVLEEAVFDRDLATSATGLIGTAQTGDSFARIGANGASLTALATAAELAKVPKSDSNVTFNATAAAQLQSEANDALVAIHLDHLLAATYDPASKPGAADALLNELVESDAGVARFTSNALEEGPSGGGGVPDEDLGLILDGVTASAGSTSTITIDADYDDDHLRGHTVYIVSGTGAGQSRTISEWVNATNIATVSVDFDTAPSSDSVVNVFATAVGASSGGGATAEEVADEVETRSLTVGAVNAGAINAAAIANGAIDAATFAGDVDAEFLSYLVDDATRIDATALNTATGTSIPAILVDTSTTLDDLVDDLESRLTATRAGYMDKLNITGNVASQASVDDVPTNSEVQTMLDALAAAGVFSLGYRNAAGDECTMVISESTPNLTVSCTEAE